MRTYTTLLGIAWNVGVVKIWILRKECDALTNRIGSTRASTLASKAWKPADELNYILTQKEHYVLLIQRPGPSSVTSYSTGLFAFLIQQITTDSFGVPDFVGS